MTDHIFKIQAAASAMTIGMDFASGQDHTAYCPRQKPPQNPTPKRAKVKAARKQRNRK